MEEFTEESVTENCNDREYVLKAVKKNGKYLEFASDSL